jgi:hypothetical protein
VNVGVALYAPEAKYIGCLCNTRYGRLNKMFLNVDGDYFRGLVKYIETRFEEIGDKLRSELPLHGIPKNIVEIAKSILPQDDSSLQWSEAGGGQTLRSAYTKAENILNKMPVEKEFVRERDVEKFSEALASEIAAHDDKR